MPSASLDMVHAHQVWFAPAGVRIRQWPAQLASRGLVDRDAAACGLLWPGRGRIEGQDLVELAAGADGEIGGLTSCQQLL
jgi:hypothetical protein